MTADRIETAEELAALPVGTSYIDQHHDVAVIIAPGVVRYPETADLTTAYAARWLPGKVVVEPTTGAAILPVDDARTAWERYALSRFLASGADIPAHIMKDYEVALWGACHLLRLMRPDVPAAGLRVTREAQARVVQTIREHASLNGAYPISPRDTATQVNRAEELADDILAALGVTVADEVSDRG